MIRTTYLRPTWDGLTVKYNELLKETKETREIHKKRLVTLENKQSAVSDQVSKYKSKVDNLKQKVTFMEAQMEKENLRFHGLKTLVTHFLIDGLKIPSDIINKVELSVFALANMTPPKLLTPVQI